MSSESYKKWIIITLFLIVFGIGIFALTRSYYKTEKPADESSKRTFVPGPIIDSDIKKRGPLEQAGKGSESPESLARLGDKYFENNRFEEAIVVYEKVLKLNPDDVDTYNDMGLALYYTGKSDIAIETLRKGTEVMPSFQRIWLSLGFVLTSTGKNEEAKLALKKAIDLNPNSEQGREAKRILGKIMEVQPR